MAANSTIYLIHLTGYNPATAQVETRYFSVGGAKPRASRNYFKLSANSSDIWLNTFGGGAFLTSAIGATDFMYSSVIKDPGDFQSNMFGDGKTFGKTSGEGSSAKGTVTLVNADGALDYLKDWGLDGRQIDIYKGNSSKTFSQFVLWFSGTMDSVEFFYADRSASTVQISLRDKWTRLNRPIQTNRYLGTNSGATGLEGLPNDIKNNPKPLAYGEIFNFRAIPVNTSTRTYQLHDGIINSVVNVYDSGVELVKDTSIGTAGDFANSTLLLAASIASSKYATCLAEGYIRLSSDPAGEVTVNFTGDKTGGTYVSSVSDIVNRIALRMGFSASELETSAFTALNTANNTAVGIAISDERNASDVVSEVLNSIGAFGTQKRSGLLTVGRLEIEQRVALVTDALDTSGLVDTVTFVTSAGSNIIKVYALSSYVVAGDTITISNVTTSVGGLPASTFNGTFTVVGFDGTLALCKISSPALFFDANYDGDVQVPRMLVYYVAHGLTVGESFALEGATAFAGLTTGTLNTTHTVTKINSADAFMATLDALPTSGTDGGGANIVLIRNPQPVLTINKRNAINISKQRTTDTDRGLPAYRINLNYKKNFNVQNSGALAGASPLTYRAFAELEYRSVKAEDSSVLTKHLLATEIERDSLIVGESAANTEAARLLTVYKKQRELYKVSVQTETILNINDVIKLEIDRFGLNDGKLFRVLGIIESGAKDQTELTLWG
jgi:hypothetical protein